MESQSGIMAWLVATDQLGNPIGCGYVVWKDNILHEPVLVAMDGSILPSGWYILHTIDIQLVIAPKEKQ